MTNTLNDEETVVITEHPFEGLVNEKERLAKTKLAHRINAFIQEKRIKQQEVATLLGVTELEISQLAKGRLSGFTVDRLYHCLSVLDES